MIEQPRDGHNAPERCHTIAVIVPVYRGEPVLTALVNEVIGLDASERTPEGVRYVIEEVVLVHDCGPDGSDRVIRNLCSSDSRISAVWLTRNFGQHAATLAGIAATGSDWVATIDEDGQFCPADIPVMLDAALSTGAPLVYARPRNRPPHSRSRNLLTELNKRFLGRLLVSKSFTDFSSFRLILGETARSVAAYAGFGTYLDVILNWVTDKRTVVMVDYRRERRSESGYSTSNLFAHFWRMVLTGGTRPLRLVALLGAISSTLGTAMAIAVIARSLVWGYPAGFASVFAVLLTFSGLILLGLGVLAEYVGAITKLAMGRPLYVVRADPKESPLHRELSGE